MDNLFTTKKSGKSSREHTWCQLFLKNVGFVYVVLMRIKKEVLQAVNQFTNNIGAPYAIIRHATGYHKSQDLQRFINEIGTTLKELEEDTLGANKEELYIGIIK